MIPIVFVICTYNQNENLRACYDSLLRELPGLGPDSVFILNNHSHFVQPGPARVFHNALRPDWSTGYLARSWNQGLLWGFERTAAPRAEWVCLVQADVVFRPGWHARFRTAVADADLRFVCCGPGDQAVFTHIDAFRRIGWWDERFAGIGYHEFDYLMRAYLRLGRAAAIEGHGPQLVWNWPRLDLPGLDLIERQAGDRSGHTMRLNPQLLGHLLRKWGRELVQAALIDPAGQARWTELLEARFADRADVPREYNWYPYVYKNDPADYAPIYHDYVRLGDLEEWVERHDLRRPPG